MFMVKMVSFPSFEAEAAFMLSYSFYMWMIRNAIQRLSWLLHWLATKYNILLHSSWAAINVPGVDWGLHRRNQRHGWQAQDNVEKPLKSLEKMTIRYDKTFLVFHFERSIYCQDWPNIILQSLQKSQPLARSTNWRRLKWPRRSDQSSELWPDCEARARGQTVYITTVFNIV